MIFTFSCSWSFRYFKTFSTWSTVVKLLTRKNKGKILDYFRDPPLFTFKKNILIHHTLPIEKNGVGGMVDINNN